MCIRDRDDCAKFVAREKRRGNTYDGIIMDPPSYGRGPGGEIWKLEDCIYDLISQCEEVLSDTPLFFAVNSYTTGLSPAVMEYMLKTTLVPRFGGKTSCDEIGLPVSATGGVVPCGATTEDTMARAKALLERLGRQVVTLKKSVPGFLVNRFAQALFRESLDLLEKDVATPADIDRAVKYAVGMRYASIGLLEYFDAVGFELERAIAENVYPTLCNTDKIQKIVSDGIRDGRTGQKAGEGLYRWDEDSLADFRVRLQEPFLKSVENWTARK